MRHSAQRELRVPSSPGRGQWRWRQYRGLLGLGLLASVVLGYWVVTERARSAPDSVRHPALLLIPDRSLPDPQRRLLDEITIELAPPAPITFTLQRRRDGRHAAFYLTPPGSRAEDAEVESLLSALLSAVAERQLSPQGNQNAAYRAYGVGEQQCRGRVHFGQGHALCFGADSPSGSVYVRADYSPAILVVDRGLFELISRPPERYRVARLVLEPLTNARKIELGSLQLFHDGDLWRVQMAAGGWALAEPTRVEELLQRLGTWSVAAWPSSQTAGRPAGSPAPALGAPPLRLTVDGQELARGGWPCPSPSGTQLFVRSDGESVCAEAPAARRLLPHWAELRAQSLVTVPGAQVARLQVAANLDVVRRPDGTYMQSGQPADTASVRRILALLTQSRPLTEAGAVPPPPNAVRLTVTTVLGQNITLQLWRSAARTLVQRDQEPAEVLDDSLAELFVLTPLSVAPLQLLALEPAAVQRISRRGSSPTVEVLARATGWHLREPTVAPADGAAVENLLAVLADLHAERWVSLQPRPEYGLDPPRLRLTITLGGLAKAEKSDRAGKPESDSGAAAREVVLELGGSASERGDCYGRLAGAPVAVLPAPTCATLAQPLLSALLVRLDEDRLTEVQLTPSPESGTTRSCTRRERRWQCGTDTLTAAAERVLLTALQALQQGEQPTYAPTPVAPPRWTLHLTHVPLGSATARPAGFSPEAELGAEVAPPEQTLRLYPAPDGGFLARLDQRGVTYRLPNSTFTALQAALAPPPPLPRPLPIPTRQTSP